VKKILLPFATLATAAAMAIVGWGLPTVAIAGPRAGVRIAALLPQVEVTALFALGAFAWPCGFRTERFEAFQRSLAATARGPCYAVSRAAGRHLRMTVGLLASGLLVWPLVVSLPGGPRLRDVAATRVLLIAFALFGIGLGAWASVAWRGVAGARAHWLAVVSVMASMPFAVAPVIATAGTQTAVVQAAMLLNPWIVMAGVSGLDLLRMEWLYALSPLGSLEARYVGLLPAIGVYVGAGLLMLGLAGLDVRGAGRLGVQDRW
jgi:hypothetical protein